MSGTRLLQVVMLATVCAVSVLARDNGCGPLEAGRWGLLAGAGVAPGFFKNRGYDQSIWPRSGITCPITFQSSTIACDDIYTVLKTPQNVLQQTTHRVPDFSKLFTNGVLHVTGQISYNVCSNTQYFLEGVYDRASGSDCLNITFNNFRAPAFCNSGDCSTSCDSSNGCAVVGTPLTIEQPTSFSLGNYQAYGGYLGARYYWNRVWCDRFSFFGGLKFGMLHRKQVCFTASIAAYTQNLTVGEVTTSYNFPATTGTHVAFCTSNAVSGGIQLGLDYCINHCWSVLVGVELVATAPFKSNRNIPSTISDPTVTPAGFGRNFFQSANTLIAPTGCLIQFPIWAGIRWEFDWCKRACNEC